MDDKKHGNPTHISGNPHTARVSSSEAVSQVAAGQNSWRRFEALMKVVEYLERPSELIPVRQGDSDRWLDLVFRMKQWIPQQQPQVSRAIYSPPLAHRPSNLPDVIRQVTWQGERDRMRSKRQTVTWPTVKVDYYEISNEAWSNVDLTIRDLEKHFGRFPFDGPETPGLSVTRPDYKLAPSLAHRRYHKILGRNSYVRELYVQLSWGVMQVKLREGEDSSFDSVWDRAWEALSEVCQPGREVPSYEENYLLPPDRFAKLLFDAISEP